MGPAASRRWSHDWDATAFGRGTSKYGGNTIMATTRRNSRKSVVVETVEDVTPVTAETAIVEDVTVTPVEDVTPVTDETPVDETPVVPVVTGPLVSVTIAPCGYVSQRANLGNFAVSYRHTRVERALVGTVAGVFSTEAKALKAAA